MRRDLVVTTRSRPVVMTLPEDMRREGPGPGPLPAAMLAIAEHGERIDDLRDRLTDYGARLLAVEQLLADEADRAGYSPIPAPRWWLLSGADRTAAIDRLAAWVDQVYVKSCGHLAHTLAPCWAEHNLCLFVLDFLSELHSVLYLQTSRSPRTLSVQAELHLRIIPEAADLMKAETTRCDHARLKGVVA